MNRYAKVVKIAAAIVAAGAVLLGGVRYRIGLATWVLASSAVPSSHDYSSQGTAPGEKKVLYWYDMMNPEFHSDKPGKAPDGMDLVPKYAEEDSATQSHAGHATGKTGAAPAEKKILYWYDGMNPAFRSDKRGKA